MFFLKRYFTLITRFFKRVSLYGLIKILKYVWFEFYFDNKRGVKTRKIAFLPELSLTSDSHCYMATTEQTFKRIIKDIPKEYFNKNFLDIGCGRGKVLILAKENGFKAKIIGIELSKKLVESCKENISKNYKNIQVKNINALDYKISNNDGVFFFYNPFSEVVFNQVLNNIIESVIKEPRKILVVYVNPTFEQKLKQKFNLVGRFDADLGQTVAIYEL